MTRLLYLCQLKSILAPNPSVLKRKNVSEYFTRTNYKKYATIFIFLTKSRYTLFLMVTWRKDCANKLFVAILFPWSNFWNDLLICRLQRSFILKDFIFNGPWWNIFQKTSCKMVLNQYDRLLALRMNHTHCLWWYFNLKLYFINSYVVYF